MIGYVGTNYGQRPLWQSEQYIREYRQWYGVRGIFLDQSPDIGHPADRLLPGPGQVHPHAQPRRPDLA